MTTLEKTLSTGKEIKVEFITGNEPYARVIKEDGKYEAYGIELDSEILEEESIEEQCLFNLSSFSKEEKKEIAKFIEEKC